MPYKDLEKKRAAQKQPRPGDVQGRSSRAPRGGRLRRAAPSL